jgi:hypothetical protein
VKDFVVLWWIVLERLREGDDVVVTVREGVFDLVMEELQLRDLDISEENDKLCEGVGVPGGVRVAVWLLFSESVTVRSAEKVFVDEGSVVSDVLDVAVSVKVIEGSLVVEGVLVEFAVGVHVSDSVAVAVSVTSRLAVE